MLRFKTPEIEEQWRTLPLPFLLRTVVLDVADMRLAEAGEDTIITSIKRDPLENAAAGSRSSTHVDLRAVDARIGSNYAAEEALRRRVNAKYPVKGGGSMVRVPVFDHNPKAPRHWHFQVSRAEAST